MRKYWFKFYGQDFLTDTKLISMDPLRKIVFITLMCLADEDGVIDYINEDDLIKLSGIDNDDYPDPSDYSRVTGCLEYFKELGMITVTDSNVTRNKTVTHRVTLCNWKSRQGENLSNAERQKKYREKHKIASKKRNATRNDSNVTQRNDSNTREDKNREDKNISTNVDTAVAVVEKKSFGNQDINQLGEYFLSVFDIPKEDCTQAESRRYWNLLLKESKTGVDGVRWLIDLALSDEFYKNNITSSKDLYYKRIKLMARKRGSVPIIASMPKEL